MYNPTLSNSSFDKISGIYVHIPFCTKVCPFCSFNVVTNQPSKHEDFVTTICEEMNIIKESSLNSSQINSVYLGGGTPSILSSLLISKIIDQIRINFKIDKNCVFSIEVNPEANSPQLYRDLLNMGLTRLSLGIQSFNNDTLAFLGRQHTAEEGVIAIENAKNAGFKNINLDFIYGAPYQRLEEVKAQAEIFATFQPEHVSAYALTLEPNTPFFSKKSYHNWINQNDSIIADMFQNISLVFSSCNLELYEISNFATTGHQSPQNIIYWNNKNYIGFGPGAHSKIGNIRRTNFKKLSKWSNAVKCRSEPWYVEELLTPSNNLDEMLLIRLRNVEGLSFDYFERHSGLQKNCLTDSKLYRRLSSQNVITESDYGFHLSPKFILHADKIALDFSMTLQKHFI